MPRSRIPIIGRSREIAELGAALDAAAHGAGSLWWLSGEAGIGKSRMLEQLAALAGERGARIAWGRCWEAGGAPAFWPWIQVLRALLAGHDGAAAVARLVGARRPVLAELLPELRDDASAEVRGGDLSGELSGEEARFQVLEAVSGIVGEEARRTPPLVLAFDDFHAADPSSVLLLEFLGRGLRDWPLMVVASCREPDASRSPVAPLLAALARLAHPLPLGALGEDEVAELVAATSASTLERTLASAIQHATEGNPLFVIEMTRLCESRSAGATLAGSAAAMVPGSRRLTVDIPATLGSTLRARLGAVSAPCRALLEAGALVGREFALRDAATLARTDARQAAELVAPAVDAALVSEVAPGRFRFGHILIREVCYQAFAPVQRAELHGCYAEALEHALAAGAGHTSWAEAAHHWLASGPAGRERAIAALRHAARAAALQHAYEDASQALERALRAWDEGCAAAEPRERAELLLELARTRNLAGDGAAAETSCMAIAELARRLGDPELLARAALEQGAVLVYARVDARLVTALEEALAALPSGDSALRAQVMARLAAAEQPAEDPTLPMELARSAITMARRVGDDTTLLAVLTSALAALMDFAAPAERLELNREHVALAERLGAAALALRGSMRLAIDHLEMGDEARARDALARCRRLAERIAHPHHQWPVEALDALQAIRAGRFAEAERAMLRARALAERARDPNGSRGLALQRWWMARLRGDHEGVCEAIAGVERSVAGLPFGPVVSALLGALASAERGTGSADSLARILGRAELERLLTMQDLSVLSVLAETALGCADTALMGRVRVVLEGHAARWVSWGLFGLIVEGPVSGILGRLAARLGEVEEAERLLEAALGLVRERGLAPYVAHTAFHLAEVLACARPGDPRAAELLDEASRISEELGLVGLAARAGELGRGLAAAAQPACADLVPSAGSQRPLSFLLRRAGETWQLVRNGRAVHLKDSKGLRMLGALVDEPGLERHVLDLVALADGVPGCGVAADGGDAGELLDVRAREGYRRRVAELRAEIDEAEGWNDVGRAQRGRDELQAITDELARGVGLGGRERRAGGAAERARVNVQRRLRDAIRRIEEHDAEVGRYLARCIRTGTFCSFEPV